jgi:lysophospholipase L1-like esterase
LGQLPRRRLVDRINNSRDIPFDVAMRKKSILLIVGLVAGLGISEVVISAFGLAPEVTLISVGRFQLSPNPNIGYEPVPFFEYSGEDLKFYEFRGKSNSLGFRDREHRVEKPEGTYRILILGDSISMGLMVKDDEDIFPNVLERRLKTLQGNAEVLNFGVSGYNTRQEVATLIKKGLVYDPDLVVVQYCLNDRMEMNGGIIRELCALENSRAGIENSLLNPLLSRSALYRFLYFRVLHRTREQNLEQREETLALLKQDSVEESFQLLRATASEHDFDVLVAVFPVFAKVSDIRLAEHRRIAHLSSANGFFHLDLSKAFTECSQQSEESISLDPLHPSVPGHACAATAIADYISQHRLMK